MMAWLTFLVSIPIAVELIAALLGLLDIKRHPQYLPRKLRRCAWVIAIASLWLTLHAANVSPVVWGFATVMIASVLGHYLPRATSIIWRSRSRADIEG